METNYVLPLFTTFNIKKIKTFFIIINQLLTITSLFYYIHLLNYEKSIFILFNCDF